MKNTLSVLVLQSHSVEAADTGKNVRDVAKKLIHNPIIVSAAAGMLVPPFQIPLPGELQRFLGILSGLVFFWVENSIGPVNPLNACLGRGPRIKGLYAYAVWQGNLTQLKNDVEYIPKAVFHHLPAGDIGAFPRQMDYRHTGSGCRRLPPVAATSQMNRMRHLISRHRQTLQ